MTKGIIDSPVGVILSNLIIACSVYFILVSEFAVSLSLMLVIVIVLLILEKKGFVNYLFGCYTRNRTAAFISLIPLILVLPFLLGSKNQYVTQIACMAAIYGIAALGLNFQMGSTDMVNFAAAMFMGIGGYSVAVANVNWGLSPWLGMAMGIALAAVFSVLVGLPTLKTKGYYLSLVTMAVQLAFTQVIMSARYIGSSNGIPGVQKFSLFGFELYKRYTIFGVRLAPQAPYLLFLLFLLLISAYVAMRIYHSRNGLSLNMISQDEVAANCMGINVPRQKLFAFVVGGIFLGIAGGLFTGLIGNSNPSNSTFSRSLLLICMVILGGMDNVIGVIVGAFLLTVINEKLRDFAEFQQLAYGLILVITLIVRPNGIIPKRIRDYCGVTGRKISQLIKPESPNGE